MTDSREGAGARPAAAPPSRFAAWRQELRETGEVGKLEWERLFARWGEQWRAFREEPLVTRAQEARSALGERLQHGVDEATRSAQTGWRELQARMWGPEDTAATE